MYRFLLTPRWWGINLFVLVAVPVCLFMGSWQLGRFEARVDSHRTEQRPAEQEKAEPLAELLPVTTETSGRTATATGRYTTQLLVPGRELDDERGFYVLTLLRTEGGDALPVVRGWLPGDARTADAPAPPTGEVTVTGTLQASENQSTDGVNAAGGLPEGQLGMISAASLVNLVPYEVYDAWITLPETQADGPLRAVPPTLPQGTGLDLKAFQNLGYTGQWFVFAGFVVFMWFRLLRREAEARRDMALGLVPGPERSGPGSGPARDRRAGHEAGGGGRTVRQGSGGKSSEGDDGAGEAPGVQTAERQGFSSPEPRREQAGTQADL